MVLSFMLLNVLLTVTVNGSYVLKLRHFGFRNPTGTCHDCYSRYLRHNRCCDNDHKLTACNGSLRCDSYFNYCLRSINEIDTNERCSYPENKVSSINIDDRMTDFTQKNTVLGLANPLQLHGLTDKYEGGVQLYIAVLDFDAITKDDLVDILLINHNLSIGVERQRQNYSGVFGLVTMDLSITALCAQNFRGSACNDCVLGFTGPHCSEGSQKSVFVGSTVGGTIGAIAVLTAMIVIALVVFKRHRRSINNSIQDGGTTLPLSESANKFRDHTADMEEGVYDYPIYESAGSYQGTAVDSTSFMLDKQDLNSTSIQSHKLDNPRE